MKSLTKPLFVVLGLAMLFVAGFSWRDIMQGKAPSTESLGALVGKTPAKTPTDPRQIFRTAYEGIIADAAQKVDRKKLQYAGLAGMFASLGDPHTMFMEPQIAKEFSLETKATFAGVGARLSPDPLGARVVVVFRDGPAKRAGLRAGDLITGVNGKVVGGEDVNNIVEQVRGKPGTIVRLEVVRANTPKPINLSIKRAVVTAPTVEGQVLPGTKFGYLVVTTFSQPTYEQFTEELDQLEAKGIKGLVIDLRNNPGGLLETAIDMLSLYSENTVVVKMRMRGGREEVARTPYGNKRSWKYPVVTLINSESASASEIFAGVLRDQQMTTLVGEHTYGKASVQSPIPLSDDALAKITIAKYFLPSGTDISRRVDEDGAYISGGLPPHINVELDDSGDVVLGEPAKDNQLRKALEILTVKSRGKR